MTRTYTMTRRAEQKAQTRQRIVEAAIDLHGTVGPALTTLTMVAERAGVQRHTLYAHFPDERSLLLACSALSMERDPLPDPAPWRAVADPQRRLKAGLGALYGWYDRNAALAGCILRDAGHHELTREMVALRMGPTLLAYGEVLGAGLGPRQRAMLQLGLSFYTWRTLAGAGELTDAAAAQLMAEAVTGAGAG